MTNELRIEAHFRELGLQVDVPRHGGQNRKTFCPFCHDQRKHQRDRELSINVLTGAYNCHHCHKAGNALATKKREYVRPTSNYATISQRAREWFLKDRCLSPAIVDMPIIGSGTSKSGSEYVCFNYYKSGVHVNTKFRSIDRKEFRMITDAELCLYNGDSIQLSDYAIITEGEVDTLSWISAGEYPVVSVPNGASGNTAYLDDYVEYLAQMSVVYLSLDNDKAGKELTNTIADRIGRDRCKIINYPEGCKDANAVLQTYGLSAGAGILRDCKANAVAMPLDNVIEVSQIFQQSLGYMVNGYPETYPTGIPGLDDIWTIFPSDVTFIVGAPGAGKSNLADLIATNVALGYQWRVAVVSREKEPAMHLPGIIRKAINDEHPDVDLIEQAAEYLNDHLFYVQEYELSDILERAEQLVRSRGIKMLVIDNISSIGLPNKSDERERVTLTMQMVQRFAKKYRIPVILVAHPRKLDPLPSNQMYYLLPTGYDIAGSSQYYNLTDNVIALGLRDGYVEFATRKIRYMEFVPPTGNLSVTQVQFNRKKGGVYEKFSRDEVEQRPYGPIDSSVTNARSAIADLFDEI